MVTYCTDDFDPQFRLDSFGIFTLVSMSLFAVILLGTSTYAIGLFAQNCSKGRIETFSLISIICNVIGGIVWYLMRFVYYYLICIDFGIITSLYLLFMGLGYLSLYYVFCLRIIGIFENTSFALSYKYKNYLITMAIIMICCLEASVFLYPLLQTTSFWWIAVFVAIIMVILYFINVIILYRLYHNKLSSLIAQFVSQFGKISHSNYENLTKDNNDNDSSSNNDNNNSKDNKNDMDDASSDYDNNLKSLTLLIHDLSKYTTLLTVALGSTACVIIVSMLCLIIGASGNFYDIWVLSLIGNLVELIVNNVCLTLQFNFAQNIYLKWCKKYQNKFESKITKDINQRIDCKANLMIDINSNGNGKEKYNGQLQLNNIDSNTLDNQNSDRNLLVTGTVRSDSKVKENVTIIADNAQKALR